jgi:hypothetical protein
LSEQTRQASAQDLTRRMPCPGQSCPSPT